MHDVLASDQLGTLNLTIQKHQVLFTVVFSVAFLTLGLQITSSLTLCMSLC